MLRKKFLTITFLPGLLFLLLPLGASAQVVTASLQGVVHDPSGAVIPGASVVVRNTATGVETNLTTRRNGFFLAPSLQPGPYTVTIKARGFKTLVSNTIELQVDQQAQETFVLHVGAPTQTVTVKAQPPLLKKTTSELGTVISGTEIENLPLNLRNPFQLALLTPGVWGHVNSNNNGFSIQTNGGRSGETQILLDGIPSAPQGPQGVNLYSVIPTVDATKEFKVQTSNYSAQFGQAGSGIVNVIIKNGTNQLHGEVYEFLRNSALDANDFFANSLGIPMSSFQRSQFGFTLGGPVVIPKLYNGRNKTFFFGDFEALRQGSGAGGAYTLPTAAEHNGDFSGLVNSADKPVTIYDPTTTVLTGPNTYTRTAFPGNIIPPNRFNPLSKTISKYFPIPNLNQSVPGPDNYVNNYSASGKDILNVDNWDVKVDENINASNRFFARFSRHTHASFPFNPWPANIQISFPKPAGQQNGWNSVFDYTHIFSPSFLTEARLGFSRATGGGVPGSIGFNPTKLGFPSYLAANAQAYEFPGIGLQGYYHIGEGGPQYGIFAYQTASLSVNNTWITHRQTINFGFQTQMPQANHVTYTAASGNFSFKKSMTQGPNPEKPAATSGDGFASFLLGVGQGNIQYNASAAVTSHAYSLYLQDDWRAMPKLTLNIGVRYNIYVPRTERYNRMEYIDPTATSPIAAQVANAAGASNCLACANLVGGLVYVGTNGVGRYQFPVEWGDVAPRFGFAYQAAKNTVVRGGYGIFYYPAYSTGANGSVGQSGFSTSTPYVGSVDGLTPTNYISDPFPTGFNLPVGSSQGLATLIGGTISGAVHHERVPYSENWNFSIQQMLPGAIMAQGSYVGSQGVQLNVGNTNFETNQLYPSILAQGKTLLQNVTNPFYGLITVGSLSGPTVPMYDLQKPFPQFADIRTIYQTGGMSIYNAFQLKLQKRMASGITFLASYTGEKLIDNESTNGDANHQNIYNLNADRAISQTDISRAFSFAGIYKLPFGRGRHFGKSWGAVPNVLLGGWQMNGILTLQTGTPLALTAANKSHANNPTERPNFDPSPTGCANGGQLSGAVESRLNEYFNTACYTQPAAFTFGNVGRTLPTIREPGTRNLDFSMTKNFHIAERVTAQFRADAFNAFNQVVFNHPNTSVNSRNFGVITGTRNSPRQLQFALKIMF